MVNLILDTQTWLYLANGYNQATSRYEESQHLKLFEKLEEMRKDRKITFIVNEVIIEEWDRNKENCKGYIKKLKSQVEHNEVTLKNISNHISDSSKISLDKIHAEYKSSIENEILIQEKHIVNIETLLKKNSKVIPVSDSVRIQVSKMAQSNKAPFHNSKNNNNDALILLSSVDYLKSKSRIDYGWSDINSIFISNNTSDFAEKKGSNIIHPDLSEFFEDASMIYDTNLGSALKLSDEIIKDINEYYSYIEEEPLGCLANCNGQEYYYDIVRYTKTVKALKLDAPLVEFDPNQLQLDFTEKDILNIEKVRTFNEHVTLPKNSTD